MVYEFTALEKDLMESIAFSRKWNKKSKKTMIREQEAIIEDISSLFETDVMDTMLKMKKILEEIRNELAEMSRRYKPIKTQRRIIIEQEAIIKDINLLYEF